MNANHIAQMNNDTFREIDGKPIRWTDKTGVVHACEGSDVHPGVRLLWTLCERDVPANTAWHPKPGDHFEMCATCLSRLNREKAAS